MYYVTEWIEWISKENVVGNNSKNNRLSSLRSMLIFQ